jgi:hypothetical protein
MGSLKEMFRGMRDRTFPDLKKISLSVNSLMAKCVTLSLQQYRASIVRRRMTPTVPTVTREGESDATI